jgi:uncharacterized Rmd1/YagE family protein
MLLRCAFYCQGEGYNLEDLQTLLQSRSYSVRSYPKVLQVRIIKNNQPARDVFFFEYGVVVFWGMNEHEESDFIDLAKFYTLIPLSKTVVDTCIYELQQHQTSIDEEEDRILLEDDDPLIKLSLSHGLSQSVKLSVFENEIDHTIEANRHLPEELATKGKISLSRKKIAQKIGSLFAQRNLVNLHTDILDTPEFFWKKPKYESYYRMAVEYLDIETRINILNRRLDVIHELYNILSNELKHSHSSFLEWIIIALIILEVLIHLGHEISVKIF